MQLTYLEAIRQGIWEEMDRDPSVFCLGEDIGIYGGAFKVTDGFIDRFGPERVIDTPIAESAEGGVFCEDGCHEIKPKYGVPKVKRGTGAGPKQTEAAVHLR